MKLLTIDTATRYGSVAVASDEGVLAERRFMAERSSASRLPLIIRECMDEASLEMRHLEGIGVAVGPGSFTGLRVGVAAAKGLAYALDLPVAGFSSLAMLAMNFPFAAHPLCMLHDARKNEVYAGRYLMGSYPELLASEEAITPKILLQRISGPTIFAGEGAKVYGDLIRDVMGEDAIFPDPIHHLPRPANAVALTRRILSAGGGVSSETLLPVYLRLSEAELARAAAMCAESDSG